MWKSLWHNSNRARGFLDARLQTQRECRVVLSGLWGSDVGREEGLNVLLKLDAYMRSLLRALNPNPQAEVRCPKPANTLNPS